MSVTPEPLRKLGVPAVDPTTFRRKPKRGSHERTVIEAILDAALVSHLDVVDETGHPVVIPTLHVRIGRHVYLYGSAKSRALGLVNGSPACLTATLLGARLKPSLRERTKF